jgi:hypothetical protein
MTVEGKLLVAEKIGEGKMCLSGTSSSSSSTASLTSATIAAITSSVTNGLATLAGTNVKQLVFNTKLNWWKKLTGNNNLNPETIQQAVIKQQQQQQLQTSESGGNAEDGNKETAVTNDMNLKIKELETVLQGLLGNSITQSNDFNKEESEEGEEGGIKPVASLDASGTIESVTPLESPSSSTVSEPLPSTDSFENSILLVKRGDCLFEEKSINIQLRGGLATIVQNREVSVCLYSFSLLYFLLLFVSCFFLE